MVNRLAGRIMVALLVTALPLAAGCSTNKSDSAYSGALPVGFTRPRVVNPIKHVIIIVQQGRTFNNVFAGFPQASTTDIGSSSTGQKIRLHRAGYKDDLPMVTDFRSATWVWHGGRLNYFDQNLFLDGRPVGTYPYAFLSPEITAPYRTMASEYVLADHMFPTEFGSAFTSLQDLIAGSTFISPTRALAGDPNNVPWGCDAPPKTKEHLEQGGGQIYATVFPCLTQYPTIADTLDAAGISWRYYVASKSDVAGLRWNAFDAIKSVRYGADWKKDIINAPAKILADAKTGRLPAVAWVIPKLRWSDDPATVSDEGPSWVAAIVNAIGQGPAWKSSAIVVVWSHWGGWYDYVPGPLPNQLQLSGTGIRVPCIIISPYAKRGYVSHTFYQFGSILSFIEQTFGLPSLASVGRGYIFTDAESASIEDSFDFSKRPRSFKTIPAKYPASIFR